MMFLNMSCTQICVKKKKYKMLTELIDGQVRFSYLHEKKKMNNSLKCQNVRAGSRTSPYSHKVPVLPVVPTTTI
jgi:hypothetical protein